MKRLFLLFITTLFLSTSTSAQLVHLTWSDEYDWPWWNTGLSATNISVATDGTIYVCGYGYAYNGLDDGAWIELAKYHPDGLRGWHHLFVGDFVDGDGGFTRPHELRAGTNGAMIVFQGDLSGWEDPGMYFCLATSSGQLTNLRPLQDDYLYVRDNFLAFNDGVYYFLVTSGSSWVTCRVKMYRMREASGYTSTNFLSVEPASALVTQYTNLEYPEARVAVKLRNQIKLFADANAPVATLPHQLPYNLHPYTFFSDGNSGFYNFQGGALNHITPDADIDWNAVHPAIEFDTQLLCLPGYGYVNVWQEDGNPTEIKVSLFTLDGVYVHTETIPIPTQYNEFSLRDADPIPNVNAVALCGLNAFDLGIVARLDFDPLPPVDPNPSPNHISALNEDNDVSPNTLNLSISPNPFNAATTLSVTLPKASELTLTVVNTLGQQVAELAHGSYSAGQHSFTLDGSSLASGIYFVHAAVTGELNAVQKVVLMK